MKLLQLSFHFEYTEQIELTLDRHKVVDYVRYPMIEGKDREGKHRGTWKDWENIYSGIRY